MLHLPRALSASLTVWYLYSKTAIDNPTSQQQYYSDSVTESQCRAYCDNNNSCLEYTFQTQASPILKESLGFCFYFTESNSIASPPQGGMFVNTFSRKIDALSYSTYTAASTQSNGHFSSQRDYYSCSSTSRYGVEILSTCGTIVPAGMNRAIDGTFCNKNQNSLSFSCDSFSGRSTVCIVGSGLTANGSCILCSSGQSAIGGSTACGAKSCDPTGTGSICTSPTSGLVKACYPGYVLKGKSGEKGTICTPCNVYLNRYSLGGTAETCQSCGGAGILSCGPTSSVPTSCSAGFGLNNPGQSNAYCSSCKARTNYSFGGQLLCQICPPHSICTTNCDGVMGCTTGYTLAGTPGSITAECKCNSGPNASKCR